MVRVPLNYNLRNLWVRRTSTMIVAMALSLDVLVVEIALALEAGIHQTLVDSGEPDNLVVIARGANSEIPSRISRAEVDALRPLKQVRSDARGRQLISPELVAELSFPITDGRRQEILVRGVTPQAFAVHREVRISAGPGLRFSGSEALVGKGLIDRFKGMNAGGRIVMNHHALKVAGVIAANRTSYESEIWIAARDLQDLIHRDDYSSVRLTLTPGSDWADIDHQVSSTPKLAKVRLESEQEFYLSQFNGADQVRSIIAVGSALAAAAAAFGAMLMMYGAVARRSREIGTMRALGFPSSAILLSFLAESALLGFAAALLALPIATQLRWVSFSVGANLSFTNLSLRTIMLHFEPTAAVILAGSLIGVASAILGGYFPAQQAAKMPVAAALRKI